MESTTNIFQNINFYMLYLLVILTAIQYYLAIDPVFLIVLTSTACIYIGSNRSLSNYQFQEKKSDDSLLNTNQDNSNSLLSLRTAISIPILGSISLLAAYFAIKQQMFIVNYLMLAYVLFIGTLTMKRYLYSFLLSQNFLTNIDFPVKALMLLKVNMTWLEAICLSLASYFTILYL